MKECLVDVLNDNESVLHTYPVTIGSSGSDSTDSDYKEKALRAAAYSQLVPGPDLEHLTTRMHVNRGGALAPYGDDLDVLSQTQMSLDHIVRERAYFLWQQDGCRHGRAQEYWTRAHDQHLRERAYLLWQQEGCPDGRADEYWRRTQDFER